MPKLILVRHGRTEYNVFHRYQGQIDVPLNDEGRAQARATAVRLADEPFTVAYASDLARAYETAQIIAEPHGLDIVADARLRELGFGAWEGLTHTEIRERYPHAWSSWTMDPISYSPPGGESLDSMDRRTREALLDLSQLPDDDTVLLVGHGGSLRWLLCVALGVDTHRHWQFRFESATVSELYIYGEKAILTLFNDRHHIETLEGTRAG